MTQLCTIPGCRIRGRHLGDCDDETCRGCQPHTADEGYACDSCVDRADGWLAEIARLTPDARAVAAGLVRRGGGGASGKPGSRPPLNDGATDALDEIQNAITTLARDIAETRGLQSPSAASTAPGHPDPLAAACSWLRRALSWARHAVDDQGTPYAIAVFAEIRENASKIRGIVNGPADRKFYGICGSEIGWDANGEEFQRDEPCKGDVLGLPGAEQATCRLCKARWPTAPRARELGDKIREHAFSAKWIHEAYPEINVKTLRSWANRGRISTWWRTAEGLTTPWIEPVIDPALKGEELAAREAEVAAEIKARGPRLHYVGDVLDLAAGEAAERETERAKRERRAAARAAESEEAA